VPQRMRRHVGRPPLLARPRQARFAPRSYPTGAAAPLRYHTAKTQSRQSKKSVG
jgi:hypothetical protein